MERKLNGIVTLTRENFDFLKSSKQKQLLLLKNDALQNTTELMNTWHYSN